VGIGLGTLLGWLRRRRNRVGVREGRDVDSLHRLVWHNLLMCVRHRLSKRKQIVEEGGTRKF